MECPLVSIIMGVYNGSSTIDACIESIEKQSLSSWEFIICDDCSSDDTYLKLKKWSNQDDRIIVLHNNNNKRLAYSLNECLKKCKGKYIARMDADDESLPQRLERQVNFLEQHIEFDVVGSNRIIFDSNGDKCIRYSPEYPDKEILIKDTPFAHPTIMMRKEVYRALGGYVSSENTMRAEDLDLWFRFYEKGYRGYNIQEPLYRYREGIDDYRKRSLKAGIETAKVFWAGYKKIDIPIIKRAYALKPIISAIVPNWIMEHYHRDK